MNNPFLSRFCAELQHQPRLAVESPLISRATEVYKQSISDILEHNNQAHPREQALLTWLGRNQNNIDWYSSNKEQIKLLHD